MPHIEDKLELTDNVHLSDWHKHMGFGSFCKTRSFIHSSGVGLKKATKKKKGGAKLNLLVGSKGL
jgi:hypothetical protein